MTKNKVPVGEYIPEGKPEKFLSTGSSLVDWSISNEYNGGIPEGRTTQLIGEHSTGKSMLTAEVVGAAQRMGGKGIYCDIEGTLDLIRAAELCGMSLEEDKFKIEYPETIQQFWDEIIVDCIKEPKRPLVVIIDSLSSLKADFEKDKTVGDAMTGARRALVFNSGYRKYQEDIRNTHLTLLFVNQTRTNVGMVFGDNRTTDCGKALEFMSSVRIMLDHAGKLKKKSDSDVVLGVSVRATAIKNKVAPPYRKGQFNILFDYGIDDIESLLSFIKKEDKATRYEVPEVDAHAHLSQAIKKFEDPEKYQKLREYAFSVWKNKYEVEERADKLRPDM